MYSVVTISLYSTVINMIVHQAIITKITPVATPSSLKKYFLLHEDCRVNMQGWCGGTVKPRSAICVIWQAQSGPAAGPRRLLFVHTQRDSNQ